MFLDELTNDTNIGLYGKTICSNSQISVNNKFYNRAITANLDYKITWEIPNQINSFFCSICINDTSEINAQANFEFYGDETLIDYIPNIQKGIIHDININLIGFKQFTIVAKCANSGKSEPVWINPQFSEEKIQSVQCPFNLIQCQLPNTKIIAQKCVFSVADDNFINLYNEMITSFLKHNNSDSTCYVLLGINLSEQSKSLITNKQITIINCNLNQEVKGSLCKSISWCITQIAQAEQYMYLDADMLINKDLTHLWGVLDSATPGSFLAVRHSDRSNNYTFQESIVNGNYNGCLEDIYLLNLSDLEKNSTCVFNSGFWVCSNKTMFAIYHTIKSMIPYIYKWTTDYEKSLIREEAILIYAIAKLQAFIPLDILYNLTLHDPNISKYITTSKDHTIYYDNKSPKILHFTGKTKYENDYDIMRYMV